MLLRVVDSIFASGYLTAGGQGIRDTIQAIEEAAVYLRNRIRLTKKNERSHDKPDYRRIFPEKQHL